MSNWITGSRSCIRTGLTFHRVDRLISKALRTFTIVLRLRAKCRSVRQVGKQSRPVMVRIECSLPGKCLQNVHEYSPRRFWLILLVQIPTIPANVAKVLAPSQSQCTRLGTRWDKWLDAVPAKLPAASIMTVLSHLHDFFAPVL